MDDAHRNAAITHARIRLSERYSMRATVPQYWRLVERILYKDRSRSIFLRHTTQGGEYHAVWCRNQFVVAVFDPSERLITTFMKLNETTGNASAVARNLRRIQVSTERNKIIEPVIRRLMTRTTLPHIQGGPWFNEETMQVIAQRVVDSETVSVDRISWSLFAIDHTNSDRRSIGKIAAHLIHLGLFARPQQGGECWRLLVSIFPIDLTSLESKTEARQTET